MPNLNGGSTVTRGRSTVDPTKIVIRHEFARTAIATTGRGRVLETLVIRTSPDPFVQKARIVAEGGWRLRAKVSGAIAVSGRGKVAALINAIPARAPQGTIASSTLSDLLDPSRPSPPLSGSTVLRGFDWPIAFSIKGTDLDGLSAYFSASLPDGTVVITKSSGAGVYLASPSTADSAGVQTVNGWLNLTPADTNALPNEDSVTLTYSLWLDDGVGRKYHIESGRMAVAKPGYSPAPRW